MGDFIIENKISSTATLKSGASENRGQKRRMHPSNKYAEKPPDFGLLASTYPSFSEFVSYGPNKKPRIDWTDFNATRELTRVLLEHDYGIKWWIPDGQLCPTVPNRANYIHWIEDLLSVSPAPWQTETTSRIRGVDIGTGANCIYPLLGASLNGWNFVGTDVTRVALEWAQKNIHENPELSDCIEIRRAGGSSEGLNVSFEAEDRVGVKALSPVTTPQDLGVGEVQPEDGKYGLLQKISVPQEWSNQIAWQEGTSARPKNEHRSDQTQFVEEHSNSTKMHDLEGEPGGTSETRDLGSMPLLVGVIKESERFDFCMCNPPFFESIEEAGLNPRTACGGTPHEMVYPGGELAFITKIVEDGLQLQKQIHWYTSMVGRKINIKYLTATLRASGVTMLRTTEFIQGRTSRWGIAWSFSALQKQAKPIPGHVLGKSNISFMIEGVNRKCGAWDVLQALVEHLQARGTNITVDSQSFSLVGIISAGVGENHTTEHFLNGTGQEDEGTATPTFDIGNRTLSFRASVFQQVPGTVLIKASLPKADGPSGTFTSLFEHVEIALKKQFFKN